MSDLVVERRGEVATLILNRPESHNALNVATYRDLPDVLRDLDADPGVKVVVLRGAGRSPSPPAPTSPSSSRSAATR